MKRTIAAVVVLAAIGAGAIAIRRCGREDPTGAGSASAARADEHAAGSASSDPGRDPPPAHGPIRIHRLEPAERDQLAAKIAAARAARAARGSGTPSPAPAIPDHIDELDLEHAPVDLKDALDDSIPILSDCYRTLDGADARPGATAIVLMTLRGDPEIGTLVDPDQITDPDGKPLDPRLSDCLKTTLQSLELPPLRQDQELPIQYTFVFR